MPTSTNSNTPPQEYQEFVNNSVFFGHDEDSEMTMPYCNNEFDTTDVPDLLGLNTDMQGSDSSRTDETVPSPSSSLDMPEASRIAEKNTPGNLALYNRTLDLLQRRDALRTEIPMDQCRAFSSTPNGPKYTCSLIKKGKPCNQKIQRADRFKHHIQWHLGIKPYPCAGSKKVTSPCGDFFSSIAHRDKHVFNKDKVLCMCKALVLPSNLARHRKKCVACKASL